MNTNSVIHLVAGVLLASSSLAATYDEGAQGDLSNDRLAPTPFTLDAASNVLSGSVTALGPDRDYFTVIVPSGFALSQIILNQYASSNTRAFIGVQEGSTFTVPPTATGPDGLLGYMHFGFDQAIPSDLLDDLAVSNPPGFSIPLAAGSYSFWINQTETDLTAYQLNFVTTAVPEPSTWLTVLVSSAMLLQLRPRRRYRS